MLAQHIGTPFKLTAAHATSCFKGPCSSPCYMRGHGAWSRKHSLKEKLIYPAPWHWLVFYVFSSQLTQSKPSLVEFSLYYIPLVKFKFRDHLSRKAASPFLENPLKLSTLDPPFFFSLFLSLSFLTRQGHDDPPGKTKTLDPPTVLHGQWEGLNSSIAFFHRHFSVCSLCLNSVVILSFIFSYTNKQQKVCSWQNKSWNCLSNIN